MIDDALTAQIADELDRALRPVLSLAAPHLDAPIGADLPAELIAAQLRSDDDRLAAETVSDIMGALWPHGMPEDCGRADWWSTPLGQVCAASLGRDDTAHLTYAGAAAMLGVQRGTVSTMVQRGTLERHPDGGVSRGSVLRRLGRHTS